jgi:hypothetical protein
MNTFAGEWCCALPAMPVSAQRLMGTPLFCSECTRRFAGALESSARRLQPLTRALPSEA